MPKYTNSNLELYLKKDSKRIKKENPSLKNAVILNELSTFLGYKSYNDLQKRDNNKNLINLVDMKYNDLKSMVSEYIKSIEERYRISCFYSSLEDFKNIMKNICENSNGKINKDKFYDFVSYELAIKFTNAEYVGVVSHFLDFKEKYDEDVDIWKKSRIYFHLIIDIMNFFRVEDFQANFNKWNHLDLLIEKLPNITDNRLRLLLSGYLDDVGYYNEDKNEYESHHYKSHFLIHLINHPYFILKENKETITLSEMHSDMYTRIVTVFHGYDENHALFDYLAKH